MHLKKILLILLLALPVFSCRRSEKKVETLPGRQAELAGYSEIQKSLTPLLGQDNISTAALLDASRVTFHYGDLNTSEKFLDRYYQLNGNDPAAYLLSGQIALEKDQPKQAIKEAHRAYSRGLNGFKLFKLMAESWFRLHNYDSAGWAAGISRNIYPSDPDILLLNAKISLAQSDTVRALDYFQDVITVDPSSDEALNDMIAIYTAHGNWHTAVDLIQDKLTRNTNVSLEKELALLYIKLKEYRSADSLLKVIPDPGNAFFKKLAYAKLYDSRYWPDSSLAYANLALELNPNSSDAMLIKGKSLERLHRYYDARNVLDALYERDTTDEKVRSAYERVTRTVQYLNRVNQYKQDSISRNRIKPLETIPLNKPLR